MNTNMNTAMDTNVNAADIREITVGAGEEVRPQWPAGDASENWSETEWRVFGDEAQGRFFGGAWQGAPGTLRLDYPYDEVCVMLTGRIALVDNAGGRREFGAGQAFFVPRGFSGSWITIEESQKVFIALGPFSNTNTAQNPTGNALQP
ncbi:cupin domain-containing protein [Streptomyces sp. NPDC090052]|uniref:cupin domain-containing protein n=1 Tax=unclassified Streptomyces TaxID=2593676 RepID=UPI002E24936F|nr:cupin domain-containing protein [Streptomyces sp. NBC_01020]WSX65148.1 cupin domain-containing protein [Streptomyces sp. NBC_00932]